MKFHRPPPNLTLQSDEIHVWRADLQPVSELETVLLLLSEDEQARANRFYFEKDRHRFILARGILRLILSRYLNLAPQQLQFGYSDTGKPFLVSEQSTKSLCFNLSHSHQLALYAVAWEREIGVDVEQIRAERDWASIATRFFSATEQLALNQLDPELKLRGFFNCWTRKEALLKAMGKGLSLPLDQFAVSLKPGEPAQLLQIDWNPQETVYWSIEDLPIDADYAAAVAAFGSWRLRGWQWNGKWAD